MPAIATGIPKLDEILKGGIPEHSLVILGGMPGAGKTILSLQILFNKAREDWRVLFFTTIYQPINKLIEYNNQFSFFDEAKLNKSVLLVDLGALIKNHPLPDVLTEIVKHVQNNGVKLMVIDSFKPISDIAGSRFEMWRFCNELAAQLDEYHCAGILVGEYLLPEDLTLPEFAVADGIINLEIQRTDYAVSRAVRVYKMRGVNFQEGLHTYGIGGDGIRMMLPAPVVAAGRPEI